MAAKKKSAVNESAAIDTAASTVIAVDARMLSRGLKMTFEGMAMVFDSLGVDAGVPTVTVEGVKKTAVPADKKSAANKTEPVEETVSMGCDTPSDAEAQSTADAESSAKEPVDAADASNSMVEETADEAQPDAAAEPTSTVSIDDITKIIVQKIKQNRKNNEKIGAILKTYGAAKVGDLPASKYEAFLTDLSAI